jgi:hypothetical protein
MSDRHFLLHASNLTHEWENYVLALCKLADLCEQTNYALRELAAARDALAAAVEAEQKEGVS